MVHSSQTNKLNHLTSRDQNKNKAFIDVDIKNARFYLQGKFV